ncbi:RES family NAD+ phosphorylase [Rhodohalobacter sp. 8-1]|uniref:RES family NAD+ phosphorylase n=1 Tax=Rhodohalobacter sp. 8-1 TaxID=3131972 RepID=UPI0030EE08E5
MRSIRVWRITNKGYAESAFTSENARLWDGRFNSIGTPAVYTSGTLSLALLEILVQALDRSELKKNILFQDEIPEHPIKFPSLNQLPDQWNQISVSKASQFSGDQWINETIYSVLQVPSVVVAVEYNFIINPKHNLSRQIEISTVMSLPIDSRFFELHR